MADPGTILKGRFRLDRVIGQGGFAQVFLSTDLLLDRQVAVKVLRPDQIADTDTAPFLERFAAEARLIARLEHPHILGLYDYGQSDGLTYLVMPYVAGGSLHEARRLAGRFGPARVAGYLRQVAAALDYAHGQGIVHRDIKPQNLLLRAGGEQLLVADFGIAKVLREDSTLSGTAVIGSAAYMAPEQFQGRVGRATDIYALGCVAYELLTGVPPYPGPAERSMFGHIYGELPRLDVVLPGASADLQAVIDRALAKRPEDRFGSAGALVDAFAAALAAPPAQQPPAPEEQPTRRIDPPAAAAHPIPIAPGPTTPLAPAQAAPPPTTVLPATPPPARQPRSLVPWLALGVVTLLVLVAIGVTYYLVGPPARKRAARVAPTATQPALAGSGAGASTASTATAGPAPTPTRRASGQPVASGSLVTHTAITFANEHTGLITRAVWSPNGEFLATASEDNTAIVWRKDGRRVGTITAHTDPVRGLAWSPDGTLLATGAKDGFVHIWRVPDFGQPVKSISNDRNTVAALAWADTVLVLASGQLRCFDTTTWTECLAPAPGEGARVLVPSPDNRWLAVGGAKGSLRIFGDQGLVYTLRGHTGDVTALAWSPDGSRLASAGGNLLLWDIATGQQITANSPFAGQSGKATTVAWSPDGRAVASGADDGTLRLWRPDGTPLATLPAHDDPVNQVAWLRDGTLVSADNRSVLRWWSASGTLTGQQKGAGCGVFDLAVSPISNDIATVQLCGTVEIWR